MDPNTTPPEGVPQEPTPQTPQSPEVGSPGTPSSTQPLPQVPPSPMQGQTQGQWQGQGQQGQPTVYVGSTQPQPPPPPSPEQGQPAMYYGSTQPQPAPGQQPPYPPQGQGQPTAYYGPPQPQQPGQPPQYQPGMPQQPQQPYPQQYGPPQPGYPQPMYAPPQKKSGVPVWLWVVGGLVLLIIVVCGAISFFVANTVRTAVQSIPTAISEFGKLSPASAFLFYTYLDIGSYDAARDLLSDDMKARYSVDTLRTQWTAFTDKAGSITPSITDFSNTDDSSNTATVPIAVKGSNGKTYNVTLQMQKGSDGRWLISNATPGLIPSP